MNVHQRVSNKVNAGHFQQSEKSGSVRTVVGMHRGSVAGGNLCPRAVAVRQRGNGFNKARLLVVNFITVYVD